MQLNLSKISNLNSEFANRGEAIFAGSNSALISNIIFDFGGVICDIDVHRTEKKFFDLGLKNFDPDYGVSTSKTLFDALETGAVSPQEFRDEIRKYFKHPPSDMQIDDAWNAMLRDIPEPRIRLLEKLRKHFRIFLLSNSNAIHYQHYLANFQHQYGYPDFESLFEKVYFSYRLGCKKPSTEIFNHVLRDAGLNPNETLFIDDTLIHVEGARNAGIHAHHLEIQKGEQIMDIFMPA